MKYLAVITFDGSPFCGWQVQKNGPSVCAAVQSALETALRAKTAVTGCGRTDAGVHALNYCLTFEAQTCPDAAFLNSVNALLPDAIAMKQVRRVSDDFHPRYGAVGKRYVYRIFNSPYMDPFERGRAYHLPQALDTGVMRAAGRELCGQRDFAPFMGAGSDVIDTVRVMRSIEVERDGALVTIAMTANGFLYKMARCIAGTLVEAGRGRRDVASVSAIATRGQAGMTLPPYGLYLDRVFYPVQPDAAAPDETCNT